MREFYYDYNKTNAIKLRMKSTGDVDPLARRTLSV